MTEVLIKDPDSEIDPLLESWRASGGDCCLVCGANLQDRPTVFRVIWEARRGPSSVPRAGGLAGWREL